MIGGLHRELRRAYAAAGMLYELHLDLLYQCDLDCEHCYLDDKSRRILPTDFWIDVLDQAAALGVVSVLMSGGEVFLRRDLLELVAHARARGLFVHLKSHGGHIDDAVAGRLAELGVTSVWLSYYATEPAIHDAITRRPGSHARTRAALVALARAGLVTVASCAVMQRNVDEWPKVVAECDALGVICSLDGEIRATNSGAEHTTLLGVPLDALVALEGVRARRAEAACEVARPANDWVSGKSCVAGHLALYVSPEADVTPCVAWPMPLGNLARGDTLAAIWDGPGARPEAALAAVKTARRGDRMVCVSCAVREDCDFCPGQAWTLTRDPNQHLRSFCLQTRARTLARAAALGLPEPPLPAGLVDRDAARDAAPRPRFLVRAAPRS